MNILTEIIEKTDNIIELLNKTNFFSDYPFIDADNFKYKLQVRMQYKWEEEEEINLTSDEFIQVVNRASSEGISDTIFEMCDKGLLKMAVNPKGELVYALSDGVKKRLSKKEKELMSIFSNVKAKSTKK
jgi:ribosomal protein S8